MIDALILARIQFAANISFHILFPTITIALGWILFFFKVRFHRTRDPRWMAAYGFWVKIFALSFALGVVSGITMSFQFGTNWPGFMETVGNIAGPLLAYEVLTAFFLEATFLGIMLFGIGRVTERLHTFATLLVAVGTSLSAYWILALNTWMQYPVGYTMIDGEAHVTDWLAILWNSQLLYRVIHMLLASGLTAAFLVAGVSSYRWLRQDRSPGVRVSLRTGAVAAAILIPLQILVGDLHGLNTMKVQPAKIAAIEGVWETEKGAPLLLFALPDQDLRENHAAIGIPKVASLILTHDWNGEIKGLNEFVGEHPPVAPVFFSFRVMVGIGLLMLLVSWWATFQLWKKGMPSRFVAKCLVAMTFSGWIATLAGWYVTEIGRQPYLVAGILKTADAASDVASGPLLTTLMMYLLLYLLLLIAYISTVFYMARKAAYQHTSKPALNQLNAIGGTA
ncbi:MAG: cytochrome ubiquinol oxidase subunit I [Acidiferrobacterales bacterium]|nr:cytochrome ubiquinol oxidase subunit I [Acidiferrobacterales bacterium]